jgi:adenylate cyclase
VIADTRLPPRRRQALCAVLAAALAAALMAWLPPVRLLEERSRDALTPLTGSATPVRDIVVVDISEESLQRLGNWPWPRARMADLVEQLLGPLGARAVALDMILPEAADAAGDARLASLASHAPLTLAHVLDFRTRAAPIRVGTPAGGSRTEAGLPAATGFVANHPGLGGARCVGHIGVEPDADGVLRRVHLRAEAAQRAYGTLALALLECADPPRAARARARLRGIDEEIWRIPFRVEPDNFPTLSAESVLAGQADPAVVRGRFVLIGSSAVGLSDYIATPIRPVTAGVLVHAQVMAELLDASGSTAPMPTPGWLNMGAVAAGVLLLAWALRRGIRLGLAAWALLCAAWLGACAWAFGQGLGLNVLAPLAAFGTFTATWAAFDFAESRQATRRALSTLSHYVAQPVLKLLVRQGLERSLAPSRQLITVMVADMAGYTRLTAESSLEESARLTTEFLEAITPPVLGSGGTLDRYTGDGLIAFWGAPLASGAHAQQCFDAALHMLRALGELNTRRVARGERRLSMRIGIESGEALVGDLGSSARSVYTAVGNCINLASRLQEIAREIGEPLVVGPQAGEAIHAALRPLGLHTVRGLAEPIPLFGLTEQGAAAPISP